MIGGSIFQRLTKLSLSKLFKESDDVFQFVFVFFVCLTELLDVTQSICEIVISFIFYTDGLTKGILEVLEAVSVTSFLLPPASGSYGLSIRKELGWFTLKNKKTRL